MEQKPKIMTQDEEIAYLKKNIEALEFIADFQKDLIVAFEKETGKELNRNSMPKKIADGLDDKKNFVK